MSHAQLTERLLSNCDLQLGFSLLFGSNLAEKRMSSEELCPPALHRWRPWTTPLPEPEVLFFHAPCSNDPEFKVWRPWLTATTLTKPSMLQQKVCLWNVTFNLIFFVSRTERRWKVLFFFWLHILWQCFVN